MAIFVSVELTPLGYEPWPLAAPGRVVVGFGSDSGVDACAVVVVACPEVRLVFVLVLPVVVAVVVE